MTFDENQTLRYCFAKLGPTGEALQQKLSTVQATEIRLSLGQLLLEEGERSNQETVAIGAKELRTGKTFKSLLYKSKDGQKVVTFAVKSAALELILPLLGIAISVFVGKFGWSSVTQVGGILKTLWGKFVVLKMPGDENQIKVLQALLEIKARKVVHDSTELPSTAEIKAAVDLDDSAFGQALTRLKTLSIIEVENWGGQQGDNTHASNQWKLVL